MAELSDDSRCPCRSGTTYDLCCARLLRGTSAASTAEQLMRSRYSAFVAHDESYLLATWHPRTRPTSIDFDRELRWVRLEMIEVRNGGLLDIDGTVEFRAVYRDETGHGALHETSRFVRDAGVWKYLDGEVGQRR